MYFAEEEEAFHPTGHEESLGDLQEVLEINQQQKVGRNRLVPFSSGDVGKLVCATK